MFLSVFRCLKCLFGFVNETYDPTSPIIICRASPYVMIKVEISYQYYLLIQVIAGRGLIRGFHFWRDFVCYRWRLSSRLFLC